MNLLSHLSKQKEMESMNKDMEEEMDNLRKDLEESRSRSDKGDSIPG